MSGKCDSIHIDQKTGLTQMIRRPILWNEANQITGDSIHLINDTKTEKLDSLKVFDNAFIIQKDSIDGFNQVKGQKLYGFFNKENQLDSVNILNNAESIVYMREENGELQGIDKSKSASITILFYNKAIDEVIKYKNPGGNIWPESQFIQQQQTFDNFEWRGDERLLSKEDIFKGEPPFTLTKIQGIPLPAIDSDFFEEDEDGDQKTPSASTLTPNELSNREEDKPKIGNQEEDEDTKKRRENLINRNKETSSSKENKVPKTLNPLKKKKDGG